MGLKGIILAGVMAMVMSTVDSYINATAVVIVHDFCKPLKIKFIKNELFSARIVSYFIGLSATILSLYGSDSGLLQLFILANSFYMPIVSVPFLMALLGFRSTEKSVLLGMAAGLFTVLTWKVLDIKAINSIVIGMFANLIVLMSSHYLLKQSGGWVGIKDDRELIRLRKERKRKLQQFWSDIKSLNIIDICKNNYPQGEGLISLLGFFVMISVFSSTHSLGKEYQLHHAKLLEVLYPITLCSSALLISYPLWLQPWKDKKLVAILWNFVTLAVLVCFSFLMVLISEFSEIQLMVFMVNIILISLLSKWKLSLFNILFGVIVVTFCYRYYHSLDFAEVDFISSQFKIIYLLLLVSSIFIIFLKPKQEYQELTEDNNLFLSNKVADQKKDLTRLYELKNELLRNLEHETRTPITGITSMGQILWESYDKLTESQRRQATKGIAESSERLTSLVNNLIDLSKLKNANYVLNKTQVNLSDLVHQRLTICKKLYINEKNKEELCFDLEIEDKLIVLCDERYIARTIDNIIINAIQYCKKGTITIELYNNQNGSVEFSVKDEGIGIPKEDLFEIFDPFTVSSKTKTPAGGRGVGLALAKRVVEVHNGTIKAESDGIKGAKFTVTLPLLEIL